MQRNQHPLYLAYKQAADALRTAPVETPALVAAHAAAQAAWLAAKPTAASPVPANAPENVAWLYLPIAERMYNADRRDQRR
jgi:hypothetical protein